MIAFRNFRHLESLQHTGGSVRWLKKYSKDVNDTCQHMHLKSRWLKIRTIHFSFNFSSKYRSRVFLPKWLTFFSSKKLRWLKIRIILPRIKFLSEFWAISVFSSWKKWATSAKRHVIHISKRKWEKLNGSNFEPSRFQMHMLARVIDVLRILFEPSHRPPRILKIVF